MACSDAKTFNYNNASINGAAQTRELLAVAQGHAVPPETQASLLRAALPRSHSLNTQCESCSPSQVGLLPFSPSLFLFPSPAPSASAEYPLDYTSMVAAFKALAPPPKVYLMIPPPLYSPYPYSMNSTVINGTFPVLIPKIAAAAGADGVINIYSAMQAAGDLTCDGCHPVGEVAGCRCLSCIATRLPHAHASLRRYRSD